MAEGGTPNENTTASYRGIINVKTETDMKYCRITGCTLLGPDRMAVIDGLNNNIKLIDISNNTVISSYTTSVPPWGVTAVSTDQVAVTLPEEGRIQLLNVTSTFTIQHEIQVNKHCCGIAYKDGKFAVAYADSDRVEILDIQGQVLHVLTIEPKHDKVSWLRHPSITFGQDQDTVIVSNPFTSKVNVVTFEGQILHSWEEDLSGLVRTPEGVLFVCSWRSRSIHVVSPDFKTRNIIINTDTNVEHNSLTYCDINHRLYISWRTLKKGINDSIRVYDLKV